jgi:hypothetical protein
MRRLRQVHIALAAAVSEPELIPHDQPRQHTDSVGGFPRSPAWTSDGHKVPGSRGAGPPLLQDAAGLVTDEALGDLEAQKAAAIAAEDYRTAASVKAIIDCVTPRPHGGLARPLESYIVASAEPTEEDAQAAADFFLEHGFCIAPGIVAHGTLERVRAGWPAAEAAARELWSSRAAVSRGRYGLSWASGAPVGFRTFFDLGLNPIEGGEHWGLACALVEVAASPGMIAVAKKLLGPGARAGGFPGGRVVPPEDEVPGPEPGSVGGDGGYTSW